MAKRPQPVVIDTTEVKPPQSTTGLRIYGAGGTGINLARQLGKQESSAALAGVEPVLVDTSTSNLRTGSDGIPTFLIKDVDGSGKVRRENSGAISENIGNLLLEHGPLGLNLVIFSASGGSGSVFGPLIVQELLKRDAPVIAVVVGSFESAICATNSLNTLKSLDSIVQRTNKPLVFWYANNGLDAPKSETDRLVQEFVFGVRVLASGQNDGLDTQDIRNFLRFDRVSRAQPQLAQIDLFAGRDLSAFEEAGVVHPITLLSIFADRESLPIQIGQEYLAEGYRPDSVEGIPEELHFVVYADEVKNVVKYMDQRVQAYEEKAASRQSAYRVLSSDDSVDESGLIL